MQLRGPDICSKQLSCNTKPFIVKATRSHGRETLKHLAENANTIAFWLTAEHMLSAYRRNEIQNNAFHASLQVRKFEAEMHTPFSVFKVWVMKVLRVPKLEDQRFWGWARAPNKAIWATLLTGEN